MAWRLAKPRPLHFRMDRDDAVYPALGRGEDFTVPPHHWLYGELLDLAMTNGRAAFHYDVSRHKSLLEFEYHFQMGRHGVRCMRVGAGGEGGEGERGGAVGVEVEAEKEAEREREGDNGGGGSGEMSVAGNEGGSKKRKGKEKERDVRRASISGLID